MDAEGSPAAQRRRRWEHRIEKRAIGYIPWSRGDGGSRLRPAVRPSFPSIGELLLRQRARDESPRPDAALEVALGKQLRVGIQHGEARHAQFRSQFAA